VILLLAVHALDEDSDQPLAFAAGYDFAHR
jgi:hypothetical protein